MITENEDNTEPQPLAEDPIEEQPQEEEGQPPDSPETEAQQVGSDRSLPQWVWGSLVAIALVAGPFIANWAFDKYWQGRARELQETVTALETELAIEKTSRPVHTVEVTREVTREVIITEYVEVTSTPEPSISTEDKRIVVTSNGLCTTTEPPCEYVIRLGDNKRAIAGASGFGDECRWPEIFDLNRTADGEYPLIHLDHAILIPEVAERGTYASLINEGGMWTVIPDCSDTSGYPCMHTVVAGIYGSRYSEVLFSVFGNYAYTEIIEGANRESDCSSNGISLVPGLKIVIPKRVADNP